MHPFGVKMCTKDCYKVFGYFLGFMWIVTSFYYTMETIELLKLMKLQCTKEGAADTPTTAVSIQARIQFDTELVGKVCDFYGRLDGFMPYHIITTLIKMVPGMLLIIGIFKDNITLIKVFIVYALLEEIFFVAVFSKIFSQISSEGKKTTWLFWILIFSCVKLIIGIWILLGVYAGIENTRRIYHRYV
ncbi:uncharacterized protein LOC120421408 [Culex pipiens pallens]|uniref:uncharacterized protein LOC120421408 n=1 Tax=Culex pipiens pallens TaxID=42434 RepID=UPI001954036A|nr:uncharacterized protein LOC120421408 [Culex pipiens pallens]